MDKRTLKIVGTVILIAGIAVGSIGTHGIVMNLPISEAEAWKTSRGGFTATKDRPEDSKHATLQEDVELQVRRSALQMTNEDRRERRDEGAIWLLSGIIAVIWGAAVLQFSRSTSKET